LGVFPRHALGCIEETTKSMGGRIMKDGLRVYDADTHVEPSAEVLEKYVDPGFRARLPELAAYRVPIRPGNPGGAPGKHVYRFGQIQFKRTLAEARPRATHTGRDTHGMASKIP